MGWKLVGAILLIAFTTAALITDAKAQRGARGGQSEARKKCILAHGGVMRGRSARYNPNSAVGTRVMNNCLMP